MIHYHLEFSCLIFYMLIRVNSVFNCVLSTSDVTSLFQEVTIFVSSLDGEVRKWPVLTSTIVGMVVPSSFFYVALCVYFVFTLCREVEDFARRLKTITPVIYFDSSSQEIHIVQVSTKGKGSQVKGEKYSL